MLERLRADITLSAIEHNLQQCRQRAPESKILAMVKANAYGHGLGVLPALEGADYWGVATASEAWQIIQAGYRKPLVIMQGVDTQAELQALAAYAIELCVYSDWQLDLLEALTLATPLSVWLKVDTGMGRLGFTTEAFPAALARLQKNKNVAEIQLMSHLASVEPEAAPLISEQMTCFEQATAAFAYPRSLHASASLVCGLSAYLEIVRPGLMLYGVSPLAECSAEQLNLQPAMCLSSVVLAVRWLPKGHAIGYGATYRCPEAMPVGVVAMGYADGFPREWLTPATVCFQQQRLPVIGQVSMDSFAIDLRACPTIKAHDRVLIWGEAQGVEQLAAAVPTIPYTLLAGIGKRCVYRYHR